MLFRNTPIVTRLASVFALILVFIVGLGFFAWDALKELEKESVRATGIVMPVVESAQHMGNLVAHSVSTLKDYFATSEVETLSEGLTSFHAAWRVGLALQRHAGRDENLEPLELFLVNVNGLYPPCLYDIQRAMGAHDTFARAREVLNADLLATSHAALSFVREHARGVRGRSLGLADEQEQAARIAALLQGMWALRGNLFHARAIGDLNAALEVEKQWGPLMAGAEKLFDLSKHPNCLPYLQHLEERVATSSQSIAAFIAAWRTEENAREHLRLSSSQLLNSAQRLSVMGVEIMGQMVNGATNSAMMAMHSIMLYTIAAALLGLVLASLLGRDITGPLRRCLSFAQSVASGNLSETLALQRRDEIGLLADSINVMVVSLRRRIDELTTLELAMRQSRAVSERALLMAKAACWHVNPAIPELYVPSPELGALVGVQFDGPRPLSEWYAWVGVADKETTTLLRVGIEAVLHGERNIFDMITTLNAPGKSETLWVRTLLEGVRDESGKLLFFLGITQDVSDYMRQQHVLEAATRAQSSFIASMSHEIRNPLNAIIGLGHLLRNTELSDQQRDFLVKCDGAAQLLLGLINDILDLSKIRAGEMRMEGVAFQLRSLLQRVMGMASGLDCADGLELDLSLSGNVPDVLLGDPLRLQQVLTNLLVNACKFTSQGSVRVEVEVAGVTPPPWPPHLTEAKDVVRLRFMVSDSGIGMDQAQMDKLFQPFSQAEVTTARQYGGTGLGLCICRHLVGLMGGEISVFSQLGRGSSFVVTALFGIVSEEKVKGAARSSLEEKGAVALSARTGRILVVEDDDINALIAKELLESMGHTVDVAVNGAEAVDMVTAGNYQLVLMDLQMPVMDGMTAARRLRTLEKFKDLPILAMTAHALQGDRERILEAGMDDHIPKPIDPQSLRATLERWL